MISIIDIEASGFGHDSYPIEVGVITYSDKRYCSLIKPFSDWEYWDEEAEKVHGISRSNLHSNGSEAQEVCFSLNDLLKNTTVYSDAWVHDSLWLSRLFYRARIRQNFILSPIESAVNEAQLEIWDDVKVDAARILGLQRHRASADALLIQKTFEETRKRVNHMLLNKTSRAE